MHLLGLDHFTWLCRVSSGLSCHFPMGELINEGGKGGGDKRVSRFGDSGCVYMGKGRSLKELM